MFLFFLLPFPGYQLESNTYICYNLVRVPSKQDLAFTNTLLDGVGATFTSGSSPLFPEEQNLLCI